MKKNKILLSALVSSQFILNALGVSSLAQATSIDWSGGYRIEYNSLQKPSLGEPSQGKTYALHYLYLQPRIVASDGINISGQFDILSSEIPAYENSKVGSLIGRGLNDSNQAGAYGSNANSQNQRSQNIKVSQLYMTVDHEYGSFLVGRAPVHFGLGITHNAGLNPFDKWVDTRELVAYRFVIDNLTFTPQIARVSQQDFGGNTANDQIFVLEYDNKEIGAKAGVFHQTRTIAQGQNDVILTPVPEYPGATSMGSGSKLQTVNIFLERKWQPFEIKVEASFLTGTTGVLNAQSEEINVDAYAVVGEAYWPREDKDISYKAQFGFVSGDNPTTSKFEGYQLDRNYDVGILLFNHRLGQGDILGSQPWLANGSHANNGLTQQNSIDDVGVTNTLFLAPSLNYKWSEKLDLNTKLIYAQLMSNTQNYVDFKKDLGLELDVELVYKPRERVTWSTGVGYLMPGSAWEGGNNNYSTDTSFGFSTKAAITF